MPSALAALSSRVGSSSCIAKNSPSCPGDGRIIVRDTHHKTVKHLKEFPKECNKKITESNGLTEESEIMIWTPLAFSQLKIENLDKPS